MYQTSPAKTNFPPMSEWIYPRRPRMVSQRLTRTVITGDEHADTARDGHDLQPGGAGRLQQVMGADMGVDHEDGPEADQGQGVAVEGRPADDGDDVVGDADGQGGQEEAHDPVAVEPGQDGIGHSGDGSGRRIPDGVSEEVDEEGKDQGAQRYTRWKRRGAFPGGGWRSAAGYRRSGRRPAGRRRPPARSIPHIPGSGNSPRARVTVPATMARFQIPREVLPSRSLYNGSLQQGRNHVVGCAQQGGSDEAENYDVGMHRTKSTENEPGDIPQEVRSSQVRGIDQPRQGPHDEPDGGAQEEAPDGGPRLFGRMLHVNYPLCA